jgi:hypothetical protein
MDNTEKNKKHPDPRNWQGSGNRSIANMFIDPRSERLPSPRSSSRRWAKRREKRKMKKNDYFIDCPLCGVPPPRRRRRRSSAAAVTTRKKPRSHEDHEDRHEDVLEGSSTGSFPDEKLRAVSFVLVPSWLLLGHRRSTE